MVDSYVHGHGHDASLTALVVKLYLLLAVPSFYYTAFCVKFVRDESRTVWNVKNVEIVQTASAEDCEIYPCW